MAQLFNSLLPIALQIGIKVQEFWEMTLEEIIQVINAYNENKKREMQEKASFDYMLAHLIGLSIARLLDNKVEYPPIYDAYPNLFNKDEIVIPQQDWRIAKERLLAFAEAHNKKRGETL